MASQVYVDSVTLSSAAEWNKWDTAAYAALSGAAGTNTITATGPANLTSVATNPPLWFIPAATNTGATTINITPSGGAALGAKSIFSRGVALVKGEIVLGVPAIIVYDGTQYNLLNPAIVRGTFTASLTGCTAGVTGTAVYSITNNVVTLYLPILAGTSNTAAATITGAPAAIWPTTVHNGLPMIVQDDTVSAFGRGGNVGADGVITLLVSAVSDVFTASGAKGIPSGATITYNLN